MDSVPDTFPSLFWAYTVIWTLLSGYLVFLGWKLCRLEKKIEGSERGGEGASGK